MKKLLLVLSLLACFITFINLNMYANTLRITPSIGGEIGFLFIPVIVWAIYRNVKDGKTNG